MARVQTPGRDERVAALTPAGFPVQIGMDRQRIDRRRRDRLPSASVGRPKLISELARLRRDDDAALFPVAVRSGAMVPAETRKLKRLQPTRLSRSAPRSAASTRPSPSPKRRRVSARTSRGRRERSVGNRRTVGNSKRRIRLSFLLVVQKD